MNSDTLALRQVHPQFVQNGEITSQVFKPTPKDKGLLSCYNEELFSPEEGFNHYVEEQKLESVGVVAVSVEEAGSQDLEVLEDNDPFDGHCSIDFRKLSDKAVRKKSKSLKKFASERGWLFESGE